MPSAMCWAAAALIVAAGCGGPQHAEATRTAAADEHQGPDQGCRACDVTGAGRVELRTVTSPTVRTFELRIEASPGAGAAAGPGFAGVGVAATGHVRLAELPAGAGAVVEGTVDTIESCWRQVSAPGHSPLYAVLGGTIVHPVNGAARFRAVITDRDPFDATLAVVTDVWLVGGFAIVAGDLDVHGLGACEVPCAQRGLCMCSHDPLACEPCGLGEAHHQDAGPAPAVP